jgi:hypothetical protein
MLDVRKSAVVIGAATAAAWLLFAAISPGLAVAPLLALLPWGEKTLHTATLVIPAIIYLLVPVGAWIFKDRRLVWLTLAAPLLGGLLFFLRFIMAMSAFG